jgi:hypothetical protein
MKELLQAVANISAMQDWAESLVAYAGPDGSPHYEFGGDYVQIAGEDCVVDTIEVYVRSGDSENVYIASTNRRGSHDRTWIERTLEVKPLMLCRDDMLAALHEAATKFVAKLDAAS